MLFMLCEYKIKAILTTSHKSFRKKTNHIKISQSPKSSKNHGSFVFISNANFLANVAYLKNFNEIFTATSSSSQTLKI